MSTPIQLSLVAGLSIAGVGAAAADNDPNVWRWYVASALSAQRAASPRLHEGRASAIETASGFRQRYERYSADGLPAPDAPRR
jgi:hypothetical protein